MAMRIAAQAGFARLPDGSPDRTIHWLAYKAAVTEMDVRSVARVIELHGHASRGYDMGAIPSGEGTS